MILLDSNAFIWLLYEPHRLGQKALGRIEEDGSMVVSAVTLWELAIKHSAGKLPYPPNELVVGVEAAGASLLPLEPNHLFHLKTVELPQKDPFDRMLVAQAKAEGATFVTSDKHILASIYDVLDVRV